MADTNTTPQASAFTALGTARTDKVTLPEATFDGVINVPVMHKAVTAFLANQRQGNASTKIRKYVTGGNQKPWKQKGTGRARQGSTRAPQWVGGGTVFGPTPRAYDQYVPRQVRALAKKSALNARAREGALHVVERFAFRRPKTAQLAGLLASLGLDGRKVLLLTATANEAVYLSGRNLPTVEVMAYPEASAYDILWSDVVVVEEGALTGVMPEPLAEETEAEKTERLEKSPRTGKTGTAAKAAPKKTAKAKAKPAAKAKTAKKTTAKKSAAKPAKKKTAPKKKGSK
jgi:large subunit ribosomal protein L4